MKLLTKDKRFYLQFFPLLFFIALQNLIVYSVNLADNVMLGNYSEQALSGVALANQVQFLLQMVVGGVGEGVVVLASQYWGRREEAPIKRIIGIGLRVAFAFGLLFTAVALIAPEQILRLMCKEEAIIAEGVTYLRIISSTYVIFCLSMVLLAGLRSVENVRVGLYVSLAALLVNISLNYVLIFGHFGFPRLGVAGAAIATLIARLVELTFAIVFAVRFDKKLRMKLSDFFLYSRELMRDFFSVATPVILSGASWGCAMFLQASILGHMGGIAVAANSIAGSLFSIVSVIAYGAASAAAVFTGKTIGEGNREKLKEYVVSMQILFLLIGLISGACIFLGKPLILSMYRVQAATQAMSDQFLNVLSLTLIGTSYQVSCLTGIVRGGGHTKFVFYNDLIFMWGLVLPLSYLCAFVWKLDPVWVFFCLKSDQIAKCFVAVFEVNSYRWVRTLTRPNAVEA